MVTNPLDAEAVRTRTSEPRYLDESAQKTIFAGGSILGAISMTSCCILPLALFSVGVTTVWIGTLASLYAYKLYIFAGAAAFLMVGFYKAYRKPKAAECAQGSYCAAPISDRINKVVLWSSAVLVTTALAFPYAAPLFLKF